MEILVLITLAKIHFYLTIKKLYCLYYSMASGFKLIFLVTET